jgi:putative DNA primase/helicase
VELPRGVIDLVIHLDGCTFADAVTALTGGAIATARSPLDRMAARQRRAEQEADEARRAAEALAIWAEAQHPAGTPVEAYLNHRGLDLPDEAAGEAIRFHPRCPFKGQRTPCTVALVRDIVTNEPKAIHRTALTTDGRKSEIDGVSRLSLGPVGGGAVKLTPDEDVTLCLGVGEGIETTLSLRLAPEFGVSPVWSLLSAGQIAAFPAVAGIETLWIAVDHDCAGVAAARTLAERWRKARREVFLVKPRIERADLNDLVVA